MSEISHPLPSPNRLLGALRFSSPGVQSERLEETLLKPIGKLLKAGGGDVCSQVVTFAFEVADHGKTPADRKQELCRRAEWLVDAIRMSPQAGQASRWLALQPLTELSHWKLTESQQVQVYQLCIEALSRVELSSVLEVGPTVDLLPQDKVFDTALACMELKAGALFGLAASLGAALAEADAPTAALLKEFGTSFGMVVQMFEDIALMKTDPQLGGGYPQWRDGRPGWVWAVAANASSPEEYERFKEAVRCLPDPGYLEHWTESQALGMRAKSLAIEYLDRIFDPLEERLGESRLNWIREVAQSLRGVAARS